MPSNPHQPDPSFPEKRHDEPAPASSGEFTQLFSSAVPLTAQPTSTPPPNPIPVADGFTQIFQRADSVTPHADHAYATSADATLIFDALPASNIPASAPAAQQHPGPAPFPVEDLPPSEFTTVFTALAPPVGPAPSSQPAAVAPPSGEFTQFFSAVSAREAAAQSGKPEVVQPRSNPAQVAQAQIPLDQPPHAIAQGTAAASVHQEPKNTPPAAAPGGSFTQLFQQVQSPPAQPAAQPLADAFGASASAPQPSTDVFPAFGQPQSRVGAFTDVFATPGSKNAPIGMSAGVPSQPNAPTAQDGFTELFQPAHVVPQATSGAGAFTWPAEPSVPSPPSVTVVPGSGEFTKLMQSLSPSAQPREGQQHSGGADNAFFGASVTPGSYPGQESEFTRVQRASARREGTPQASLSPAPAAQALVEVPVVPSGKDAPKDPSGKKSRTLVILLVVMNVLLMLGLIVLAFLVLRRK